jgi:DNA polymerase III delta subunit
MIVIHGTDQVSIQNKLDELLSTARDKGLEIEKQEAKDLSPATLSQGLTPSSLFSNSRLIVINSLLSLPQSNIKKKLIDILKKTSNKELLLYETKNVHPATLKSLPTTQVFHFKESPLIFKFLDEIKPNNPQRAIDTLREIVKNRQPLGMLFFMLTRHVRQLIQIKTPGSLRLAPWQLGKITKQSSLFTTDQLISLHKKLYEIDKRQKLSQVKSLETELEHLLLSL